MKKTHIFSASGEELGGIAASKGTFSGSDREKLQYLHTHYDSCRKGINDPKTVRLSSRTGKQVKDGPYGFKTIESYLTDLLKKYGIAFKSISNSSANTGGSVVIKCGDPKQAATMVEALTAMIKLGAKLKNLTDTYTTNPAYANGMAIEAASSGAKVSYWLPYNKEQASAARTEQQQQAEVQQQQAEAQQQQADADLAAEEARRKTAAGRTLRIVGFCALAVVAVVLTVLIVKKIKKH